jgi:alkane 1-monooxygenase
MSLLRHAACLILPLGTLAFVASGPHAWWETLPAIPVILLVTMLDARAKKTRRPPDVRAPAWAFDALLYALAAIQLATIVLMARSATRGGWSIELVIMGWLVGMNSGWSAIVVGHELIHRRARAQRLLGRLLLCTVFYEHFYTEHLRGHHARVGTDDDPATARFGESLFAFQRRTIPGQLRSALRLEARRLGDENMRLFDRRQLGNRVLHGIAFETALAAALGLAFGLPALVTFVMQCLHAIGLLETVNYFEHWGLRRSGRAVANTDSWDTDSTFTLYTLIGLSRHADHHANAHRPYQSLRPVDESPKLPYGYYTMVGLAQLNNARFQSLMTAELFRKKLGPFAE